MAVNVTIYPLLSPRVVLVDAPQTEASVQDLYDAIREWEDKDENQGYPFIVDGSGKDDLGEGVFVGTTVRLINAQVRFAARPTPSSVGTATTADAGGRSLIDSAATFITDGVEVGYTVFNSTTEAMETVTEVTSETELQTFALQGGSRQDWQLNDNYLVYPNDQCTISGGNLVAESLTQTYNSDASLLFDGDNDHCTFATPINYFGGSGDVFTIMCWIYPTTGFAGSENIVGSTSNSIRYFEMAEGGAEFGYQEGGAARNSSNYYRAAHGNGALSLNTWYHVAMRRNANNTVDYFLDGIKFGGGTIPQINDWEATAIGRSDAINYSHGRMDDLIIDKSSISDEDIALIAAGANPDDQIKASTRMDYWYKFNGSGADTTVPNDGVETGGTPTLTLQNFAADPWVNGFSEGAVITTPPVTISSVLQSPNTHVIKTSSSSATLQELAAIEFSSFNGGVTIDQNNITGNAASGTGKNSSGDIIGTLQAPCLEWADVKAIADERGFLDVYVIGNAVLDDATDFTNFRFVGQGATRSSLNVLAVAEVSNCLFEEFTLTGTLDGNSTVSHCDITTLNYVDGTIENCILRTGTITLGGSGIAVFNDCIAESVASNFPIINFGGSGMGLRLAKFEGNLELENKTGTDKAILDIQSGTLTIANTVDLQNDGDIKIRGTVNITDNSTGSEVDISEVKFPEQDQLAAFNGKISIDFTGSGSAGYKFPQGTEQHPVNNLADALLIQAERTSIKTFEFEGTWVVGAADDIGGFTVRGKNPYEATLNLLSGASTEKTIFEDLVLTGVAGGHFIARRCGVLQLSNVGDEVLTTSFNECQLLQGASPSITMRPSMTSPKNVNFLRCNSGIGGETTPIVDYNSSPVHSMWTDYHGGIELRNCVTGTEATIGINEGQLVLASSVNGAELSVRGIYKITNNATAVTLHEVTPLGFEDGDIIRKMVENRVTRSADIITVYEDDGTTIFKQFDLSNGERIPL